jgi:hypothetical protein
MPSIVPKFEYRPALLLRQTGDIFISCHHQTSLIHQPELCNGENFGGQATIK